MYSELGVESHYKAIIKLALLRVRVYLTNVESLNFKPSQLGHV